MSHAGFVISFDDNATQDLAKYFDFVDKLRYDIYTAVYFRGDKNNLESFHNKRKLQDIYGYIRALYIDQKKQIVVAEVVIEGKQLFATLVHAKTNIPLINIKQMTSIGQFGNAVIVDPKIKINCASYVTIVDQVNKR
jgi:hypothetical protein